jgi:hypothetical protein
LTWLEETAEPDSELGVSGAELAAKAAELVSAIAGITADKINE